MRQVNTAAPANLNHPLCQGLELWWLALPHLAKGLTWRDISGKRRDGTLNAIDNSTTTRGWSNSTSPTGVKSMQMDGTADNMVTRTGTLACLSTGSTAFTISTWGQVSTTGTLAIFEHYAGAGGPSFCRASSGRLWIFVGNGAAYSYWSAFQPTGWNMITLVFDGSLAGNAKMALYLNGKEYTTSRTNSGTHTISSGATAYWVGRSYGFVENSNGQHDDIKVYSRPLSAAQVWSLYTESLAGHPNMLNYRGLNRTAPAAGGGGGGTVIPVFMNQYRQRVA